LKNKQNKATANKKASRSDRFFSLIDGIIRDRISSNIQLELIFAVAICLVAAFIGYNVTYKMTERTVETSHISYDSGIESIRDSAYDIAERMINDLRYKEETEITDEMRRNVRYPSENNPLAKQFDLYQAMKNLIEDFSRVENLKVMVTDLNGNIQFKTEGVSESKLDIFDVLKNSFDVSYSGSTTIYHNPGTPQDPAQEMTLVYPMNFLDEDRYLIVKAAPAAVVDTTLSYVYNTSLALFAALLLFVALFLIITRRKMDYIQQLSDTVKVISTGNFKYKAPVKGNDELTNLAKSINSMATDIDVRIEEERKLEQMKNDLITNVSHDLRTPLTSIIGYIELAKSDAISPEKRKEYIEIASSKSLRLKELIESLFEYSKLESPEHKLNIMNVSLRELIEQLVEEMIPLAEEYGHTLEKVMPKVDVIVEADVQQIVRLFENLITNAIKYSTEKVPIKVLLSLEEGATLARVSVENSVGDIDESEIPKMFERFYRLDKSRFSGNGGSGLGLAISENIVKMHSGRISAIKTERSTLVITVDLPVRFYPGPGAVL
jgi:signal transduction histidine kinase